MHAGKGNVRQNVLVGNGDEAVAPEEAKHSAESKPQGLQAGWIVDARAKPHRRHVVPIPAGVSTRWGGLPSRLAHTRGLEAVGRDRTSECCAVRGGYGKQAHQRNGKLEKDQVRRVRTGFLWAPACSS